jgi:hypothetical protein
MSIHTNTRWSKVSSHVICMSIKPVLYMFQEVKSMPEVWLARYTLKADSILLLNL